MIWIIGGTSETLEFVRLLAGRRPYLITVATPSGAEVLPGEAPLVARLNPEQMEALIRERGITQVVDLSHPFAVIVSGQAKAVCEKMQIGYFRYLRESALEDGVLTFGSLKACLEHLQGLKETVFFTTGSKNIADFESVRGESRFIYRILPAKFSLEACAAAQVQMKDIIAILGPCSLEMNKLMFAESGAQLVVMKDSGEKGGTPEKIKACKELGITPVMILRDADEGFSNLEGLVQALLEA